MQALVAGPHGGQLVALGQGGEPLPDGGTVEPVQGGLPALGDQPAAEERDGLAVDDRGPLGLALGP